MELKEFAVYQHLDNITSKNRSFAETLGETTKEEIFCWAVLFVHSVQLSRDDLIFNINYGVKSFDGHCPVSA